VADRLPTFGNTTVAAAFRRFGQLSRTKFSRNVVTDDSFRALMAQARYGQAHTPCIPPKYPPHTPYIPLYSPWSVSICPQ